jgi:hypothetical protein
MTSCAVLSKSSISVSRADSAVVWDEKGGDGGDGGGRGDGGRGGRGSGGLEGMLRGINCRWGGRYCTGG